MPVPTSNPQDTQALIAVVIILGSVICVRYWRTMLLMVVIAAIGLAVYGTIVGVDVVTSVIVHHK
jgi:hypothetical protein